MTEVLIFKDFGKYFQAGDIFIYPLVNQTYIVGQFFGGKMTDLGCLYNIYNHIFTQKPTLKDLAHHTFLYRQPIFLKINPLAVELLAHQPIQSIYCYFRCETGEESLDYFYENNLISNDEDNYIDILLSLMKKDFIFKTNSWVFFKYSIDSSGNISVQEMIPIDSFATLPDSYLFGTWGNMEMVESSIKGEYKDYIFLLDKIFQVA